MAVRRGMQEARRWGWARMPWLLAATLAAERLAAPPSLQFPARGPAFCGGWGAGQHRSISPVAMRAKKHDSRKAKVNKLINKMRHQETHFSSRGLKKQMLQVERIHRKEQWTDELLSYLKVGVQKTGGDYNMPVTMVKHYLTSIYGEEPSAQAFKRSRQMIDELDDVDEDEKEFERMECLRRKKPAEDPMKSAEGTRADFTRTSVGLLGKIGIAGHIPTGEPEGLISGGSVDDPWEEVWMSGGSWARGTKVGDMPHNLQ